MTTPSLSNLGPVVTFAENSANSEVLFLDTDVIFTADNDDFAGGTLTVSGLLAEDRVLVVSSGPGPDQIEVVLDTVGYNGVPIGRVSGGNGTDLVVTFTANATAQAIDALIQNLGYSNTSNTPTFSRDLAIGITDGTGATLPVETSFAVLPAGSTPLGDIDSGDSGGESAPAFADLDGDGDLDLVLGNGQGTLVVFENDAGQYVEQTGSDNPFDGFTTIRDSIPGFVDLDADGDLDLVVGGGDGTLKVLDNQGGVYIELTGTNSPLNGIDFGTESGFAFIDLDSDGDLDLIGSGRTGAMQAYRDDGGVFTQLTGSDNPVGSINLRAYQRPSVVDLDGDGDFELVVGSIDGDLTVFVNESGSFTQLADADDPFAGIVVGSRNVPTFADLDEDGDLDLVVGTATGTGTLTTIENTTPRGAIVTVQVTPEDDTPPTLTGFGPEVGFTENAVKAAPRLLDPQVSFVAGNGVLAGGALTVSGLLAEDRVSVNNEGTGPGQIEVFFNGVYYDGAFIGNISGGVSTTMTVTFTENVTAEAIEALIRNLTYANSSDQPTVSRDLMLNVTDGLGLGLPVVPRFTPLTGADNPFDGIVVSQNVRPAFVDLNGDGDLDLVAGEQFGRLIAFDNAGGVYTELLGAANPFGAIDVGYLSAPSFVDLDGDGDLDLVVGELSGTLRSFRNDAGTYTALTGAANPFDGIDVVDLAAPAFVDLDGDGDLDLVVGQYLGSQGNLTNGTLRVYENAGGTFTELTGANNPFGAITDASIGTPSFADLDRDGDLDLVLGGKEGTVRVFDNDGGTYTEQTGAANPFDGIDASGFSAPSFVDLDADGDLDLVVGTTAGTFQSFENTAAKGLEITVTVEDQAPKPVLTVPDPFFFENEVNAAPQLLAPGAAFDVGVTDIFNGGTLTLTGILPEDTVSVRDEGTGPGQIGNTTGGVTYAGAVIGTLSGGSGTDLTITFNGVATAVAVEALIRNLTYANSSDDPTPLRELHVNVTNAIGEDVSPEAQFAPRTGTQNPFEGIDIGQYSNPALIDLDGDGDLDLITGTADGTLSFAENQDGVFVPITGAASPFDGIDVGGYSAPAFADLDGDSDLDLVVGAEAGGLVVFQNDGGLFSELVGGTSGIDALSVSGSATPSFGDIDGDGDMDLVVGDGNGVVTAFENTGGTFTELTGADNPFDGVAVASYADPTLADIDDDGDVDLLVGDDNGVISLFENTGAGFAAVTGADSPFDGIDIGFTATPTFGDLDGDGDVDLVVGRSNGTVALFENTGARGITLTIEVLPESEAPTLSGLAASVFFAENTVNATPQIIDASVTFDDPQGDFDGGRLTVTGLLPEDSVSVGDQGTGAGQIGLSGTQVSYEGTVIGTLDGGSAGADLTITFTAAATNDSIEALIETLTYANSSNAPTPSRTVWLNVFDAAGGDVSLDPPFTELTGANNPFDAARVFSYSAPAFADLDGDGDLDLVLGSVLGTLSVFENVAGTFTALTGAANPFDGIDVGRYATPELTDLDGDGDLDLVVGAVGAINGALKVFDNIADGYVALTGAENPFGAITDTGQVTVAFADLDGDGDDDLVLGVAAGNLRVFAKDGSTGAYTELTGAANPLDGIDVGRYASPELADLDGDGDLDLLVGDLLGKVVTFENQDGVFVQSTGAASAFDGVNVPGIALPAVIDLNGDGQLDLVVGRLNGTLSTFINGGPRGRGITIQVAPEPDAPPTLDGFGPAVTFAENAANASPQILDPQVSFAAGDGGFDGGTLTLTGILPKETVGVRNQGTGPAQIGNTTGGVTYEGVVIGTLMSGFGTDLTITFTAAATAEAIEALIQNLTYTNVSDDPTPSRALYFNITDDLGGDLSPEVPFAERTGHDNPFDGIDVGSYSAPSFADLDGDGDLELTVGADDGTLRVFDMSPDGSVAERDGINNPFDGIDVGQAAIPSFGDLDGDGDLDLVAGEAFGTLSVFDNDGGVFTQVTGAANPFTGINVGTYIAPALADLDGDGDLDLIVGENNGNLNFFDNEDGVFTEVIGAANPFDGIDVGATSVPDFVDLDGDGDLDLVIGELNGTLNVFENTSGSFTELTGADHPFDRIDIGKASTPNFADVDGDGDLDLVVGESDGSLNFFENTGPRGILFTVDVTPEADASAPPQISGLPSDLEVLEDTASALDLSGVSFSDTDTPGAISLTLTVSAGTLVAGAAGGVTLSGNGTQVLSLTGTAVAIDAYLNDPTAIQYTGAPDVFGPDAATLTLSADDGFGPVDLGTVNIDITDTLNVQTDDDDPNTLTGDDGADFIDGAGGNDTISGRGGNDDLRGGTGDDTINGNAGADTIRGEDDDDTINGGLGPDQIDGGPGVDTITGADGFDTLRGGAGADTIRGNAGNDAIFGDGGDDILSGGIGADTIEGGDDADTINGNDGFDILSGGAGNDTINGNAGNDTISGGIGDDILNGGIGFDTISGEAGDDTIFGLEGFDILSGGAGMDTIQGNSGSDTIDAGADDDLVEAGQGADTVLGGSGDDILRGQTGGDQLYGETGNDAIFGGEGADRISGGADDDLLTGGAGADVFVFDEGQDTITDYSVLVDRLELDAVALQIAGLTGAEVVTEFGGILDGDTVLAFDSGDVLILTGITNSAAVLGSTFDILEM